jgi:hypothetical protein
MKLYLVVGENGFPLGAKPQTWGVLGLFKDYGKAWSCPLLDFDTKKVVEIESDFEDEDFEIVSNRKIRMLRISE